MRKISWKATLSLVSLFCYIKTYLSINLRTVDLEQHHSKDFFYIFFFILALKLSHTMKHAIISEAGRVVDTWSCPVAVLLCLLPCASWLRRDSHRTSCDLMLTSQHFSGDIRKDWRGGVGRAVFQPHRSIQQHCPPFTCVDRPPATQANRMGR